MSKDNLEKIIEAGKTLCFYCESDICEWCQVSRLIEYAKTKIDNASEDDDEHYTPSSTRRDYGPSNPWDAPGMSVHDFI